MVIAANYVIDSTVDFPGGACESEPGSGEITLLLDRLSEGDRSAEQELLPRVYAELHRIALVRVRAERSGHTLQATAVVHEVYLRLVGGQAVQWQSRTHFYRVAARVIRRILVDYARHRNTARNNGGQGPIPLEDAMAISTSDFTTAIEVDLALDQLAEINPRQAQVVEMRFFAGLSEEEIAIALGKNARTIRRDWLMARAWLYDRLAPAAKSMGAAMTL